MDPDYLAMQQPANRLCSRETATAILRKKGDGTPSGASPLPEPKNYTALDLGQRFDHSAIVSLELSWCHWGHDPYSFAQQYQPILRLASLHRFPLGLSDEEVQKLELIVDAGGPGPAKDCGNVRAKPVPEAQVSDRTNRGSFHTRTVVTVTAPIVLGCYRTAGTTTTAILVRRQSPFPGSIPWPRQR